jgi:hypothetical protein
MEAAVREKRGRGEEKGSERDGRGERERGRGGWVYDRIYVINPYCKREERERMWGEDSYLYTRCVCLWGSVTPNVL